MGDEAAVVAAVRAGDEAASVTLAERYRRQLQVHGYRMLGRDESIFRRFEDYGLVGPRMGPKSGESHSGEEWTLQVRACLR